MKIARRPLGWLFFFALILASPESAFAAPPAKTAISDVVYRADGSPAAGTVTVSWPAFTGADGTAVAAGNLTQTIAAGGLLNLALVPNTGAIPAGSYYTVVLHLADGKTSTEYWTVPVATSVKIADIRAKVIPQSIASQTVSPEFMKSYVDSAILAVPATKGLVAIAPTTDQAITQPAGTAFKVNRVAAANLNGSRFADQFSDIQSAIADAGTTGSVTIPASYSAADPYTNPNKIQIQDLRGKADRQRGYINPVVDCGVTVDGPNSISTAFQACMDAHPGKHFKFPSGTYRISSSINFKGQGPFIDCGNAGVSSGPVHFIVDAGVTAFVADNALTQHARIEGCWGTGAEPWTNTVASTFVLPMGWGGTSSADFFRCYSNGCVARNNLIENFGRHAINIDTANYSGNANTFVLDHNRAVSNRGMCIHIQGVDSNAGKVSSNSCVANQLGGEIDDSFLGNGHDNGHADLNGVDQTAPAAAKAVTNSAISKNYATVTIAAHGFVVGDNLFCTGSTRLAGRWQVLDVPDFNNVVLWMPGIDKASGADTGTCARIPGSSGVWMQTLTGCSLSSGSASMTCTGGGYTAQATGYPVNIPGAGPAGANLVTWIHPGGTAPNFFALRNAASTTVTSVNAKMIIYPVPYKAIGAAQNGGKWDNMYSELAQNQAQFNQANRVDGGDQGPGVDVAWGATFERADSNGLHFSTAGTLLFDNGNNGATNQTVNLTFKPGQQGTGGAGSNGTTNRIFLKATDGNETFRESVDTQWFIKCSAANKYPWYLGSTGYTDLATCANGTEVRLNRQSGTASSGTSVGFYDGGTTKVGSVDSTGKATFNGGVLLNTTTAKPSCTATSRGEFWITQGAAGVKDSVEVCAKDAADAYGWRTLY
jgi:hypothetical protein